MVGWLWWGGNGGVVMVGWWGGGVVMVGWWGGDGGVVGW